MILKTVILLWVWPPLRWDILYTTLCDKVCQWLATGQWFSLGAPVSSTNKTDRHDITETLLKVALIDPICSICTYYKQVFSSNVETLYGISSNAICG
jgi:hypothetical protein